MEPARIQEAARLLAAARRERARIALLPAACRPQSIDEAHAIQDAVTAALGATVGAFKASQPKDGAGMRAPIYASLIHPSPARFPVADAPQCGAEGEIAFRFRRDLPARAEPYGRDEVAEALEALPAIEVVTSRYADPDAAGPLDKLADAVSNGGFVTGAIMPAWRGLDLGRLRVTLTVNDAVVVDQAGGHPTGDPLGIAVALVEMMRGGAGVRAGQIVTTGSCTGLRYFAPGDRCRVAFEGLGAAELTFTL